MDPVKWLVKAMLLYQLSFSSSLDAITPQHSLRDGDVLISTRHTFGLGFFSPANSRYRYVGIWYHQILEKTVVWVANRQNPINDTSGILSIGNQGNLVLYHKNHTIPLWFTNSTLTHSKYSTARLLDSGNLLCLYKGSVKFWRGRSWTGRRWVGVPEMKRSPLFNYSFADNDEEISAIYWSAGCVRNPNVSVCQHGEGFVKVAGVKIPDIAVANADMRLGLKQCQPRNCSCVAYATAFSESIGPNGGTGCLTWYRDLLDIKTYRDAGQDLFVRVDAVVLGKKGGPSLSFATSPSCFEDDLNGRNAELPVFNFGPIAASTNNFSSDNRLGQGGFGPVYKVLLHFTLLLLSSMASFTKTMTSFLRDESKRSLLDWESRLEIISGIARGIVYLHQDSRLRIIHRDLKTSNFLLDAQMNPKISDFGLAKIFGGDQVEADTKRIVGTYGYMSPEYAMQGHFSIKSDVYSFGVLLLEILTGRINNGHYPDSPTSNLIGHVWELWKNDKAMEIVDSSLGGALPSAEVLRCLQIGLLCVQESATDRPKMSAVVAMLGNDASLPSPKQPAFFINRSGQGDETGSSQGTGSINTVTLTMPHAR
ncbi:hypothetical protein J1N35_030990 [Gossypium stocksii]|uniref:non-specific serine/threonine protein kinase n=1 Tax=Gossypium stocksii TaxID=47602 RepID=A0A9D3V0N9_9ROSI|nr:hypothetical protein J1N35_030990 [Gossypium stocksii]